MHLQIEAIVQENCIDAWKRRKKNTILHLHIEAMPQQKYRKSWEERTKHLNIQHSVIATTTKVNFPFSLNQAEPW